MIISREGLVTQGVRVVARTMARHRLRLKLDSNDIGLTYKPDKKKCLSREARNNDGQSVWR